MKYNLTVTPGMKHTKGLFRRRLNLQPNRAVLGNSAETLLDVPNRPGYYYVRRFQTGGTLGAETEMLMDTTATITLKIGQPVLTGMDEYGEEVILKADAKGMLAAGQNPAGSNPNNPQLQFINQSRIITGLCTPNYPLDMTVLVNAWIFIIDGEVKPFFGSEEGGVDLSTVIPATGNHRLALVSVLPDMSIEVTVSTEKAAASPLGFEDDLQECIDGCSDGATPIWAWRLYGDMIVVSSSDSFLDVRNFLNVHWAVSSGSGDFLANGSVPMTGDLDLNGNVLTNTNMIDMLEGSAPSTPASGHGSLYAKTDSKLYFLADDGTEYDLTAGAGGGSGNIITRDLYANLPGSANAGDLFAPTDGYTDLIYDTAGTPGWRPRGVAYSFTDPNIPTFSWDNMGTATVVADNGALVFHEKNAHGGGFQVRVYYRAAPSTPYSVTIAYLYTFVDVGDGCEFGLCWRASGSGKLVSFSHSSVSSFSFEALKWNTSSSFSGSYGTSAKTTLTSGGVTWMRLSDDGTNRTMSYSADGRNFLPFHTVGRTDFMTPDQIGFYFVGYQTGAELYGTAVSYLEAA